jgi:enterochelin esterase-like enzyme
MRSASLIVLSAAFLAGAPAMVLGQGPPQGRPRSAMGPIRSPEVQKDGRATFRFRAPNAKEVLLARDGSPRSAMQKDDQGIWSVTTEPLAPDLYPYSFVVDGVMLSDPSNPLVKPIVMGGQQSIAHVPGPASLSWEVNDVPHGTLHRHSYRSAIAGEGREFVVYTPPGYDPAGKEEYPVLYLLHGITDDASAWTMAGRMHVILDNLIARGKARPMLVVNPLGYAFPNVAEDLFRLFRDRAKQQESMEKFSATVLDEIIPRVEKDYRVAKDRNARAIVGLSMGGAQALNIGLNHPDRFGWVGSFSGAFVMYGDDYAKSFPNLDAEAVSKARLVWLACGTEDFLIEPHRKFERWLKSKGVHFTSTETPGAHTWMVWRRYLTDLAPLLFREPTLREAEKGT